MKKITALLFLCMFFVACSEEKTVSVSPELAYDEVYAYRNLPKCDITLYAVTYYVQSENTKYKCLNEKWENEISADTEKKITSNSSNSSKTNYSSIIYVSRSSSSLRSSSSAQSSSSSRSSSSSFSSSSVFYTIALFGNCTDDRKGEKILQNDSTKFNYLAEFICEPPSWHRMMAYDYSLEELHKSSANYGTLIDERDGEVYKTVVIGKTEWMAENLRYKIPNDPTFEGGKNCFQENPKYCKVGGYYYSYADRDSACPADWYLPNDDVVTELKNRTTDNSIKSQIGWYTSKGSPVFDNTNESGFTLLPEIAIMAAGTNTKQKKLGYYKLPQSGIYSGQSYAGDGKYVKAYHIRCVRQAQLSSSSVASSSSVVISSSAANSSSSVASSSSAANSSNSTAKSSSSIAQSSSSSAPLSSSSVNDATSSSSSNSTEQQSSSSIEEQPVSSSSANSSSAAEPQSSSSVVEETSSSDAETPSSSSETEESSASTAEDPSSSNSSEPESSGSL